MTAGTVRVVGWCLLAISFLHFLHTCSAQDTVCSVTQDGAQTTYTIPYVPPDSDMKASRCEYSWANATDYVLANNVEKLPELVMRNSITSLVTSHCIYQIVYTRSCMSERVRYTTNCTIKCTGNAGSWKDDVISPGVIAAVLVAVIVVAIVLFGFLCYIFRNKCPRIDWGVEV